MREPWCLLTCCIAACLLSRAKGASKDDGIGKEGGGRSARRNDPRTLPGLLLPKQTRTQAEVWESWAEEARRASLRAIDQVMALLQSSSTKRFLKELDDGSGLYTLSATTLFDKLMAELDAAELVHNFGHENTLADEGNCGLDVTLEPGVGPGASYFYNQWVLQALELAPLDVNNNVFVEATETSIFSFPAFARDPSTAAPEVHRAADRPTYAALNMFRNSAGNPQCGPISAIFSRGYVGEQALAAPVDTGLYYGVCGLDAAHPPLDPGMLGDCNCLNCTGWPEGDRNLGVPGSLNHLVLPYLISMNATRTVAGADYPAYNLARLLTRLLSRRTYQLPVAGTGESHLTDMVAEGPTASLRGNGIEPRKMPESVGRPGKLAASALQPASSTASRASPPGAMWLTFPESTFGYFEVNPVVTMKYPEGITMLVGVFEVLFGTQAGRELREWCVRQGWVLAWAHNPIDSLWVAGPAGGGLPPVPNFTKGIIPANLRLVDPWVLEKVPAGHNGTDNAQFAVDLAEFQDWWAHTELRVAPLQNATLRRLAYDASWCSTAQDLAKSSLAVEPIYAGACHGQRCSGVRIADATCLCEDSA